MDSTNIFLLVGAVLGIILGWKPVTQMIGRTNLSLDQGALSIGLSAMHLSLKIVLSFLLGYIFFIIYIIKFIINRIKAKNAAPDNTQNSPDGAN